MHESENVFFFSNRFLAAKVKKPYTKVNKYINLFCALGLLKKVSHTDINKDFRKRAEQIASQNVQLKINFYVVPKYTEEILITANKIASFMVSSGFSIKGMSKKYIENCLGTEFANKLYLLPIKESNFRQEIREQIEYIILDYIKEKGYFTKQILMSTPLYTREQLIKNSIKEYEFRRSLPDILNKYDLVYVYANKEINTALGTNIRQKIVIKSSMINL